MRAENVKGFRFYRESGRNNTGFCFMGENQNQKNNKHN
jgi:hypothetical protein